MERLSLNTIVCVYQWNGVKFLRIAEIVNDDIIFDELETIVINDVNSPGKKIGTGYGFYDQFNYVIYLEEIGENKYVERYVSEYGSNA